MDWVASLNEWVRSVWADWHSVFIILFIVVGALILRLVLQLAVRRVVRQVVKGANKKLFGNNEALNELSPLNSARVVQRAQTMGSVLGNFITWSIVIVAITMVLSELGVAVGALATGAGLLGAGLGFGSQALVKDLISGLFIVFEDQYGVGDVVDLGQAIGVVESVGLRVTQVRDSSGTLWYVRNGEVMRVGNQSQGWSRVILDLPLVASTNIPAAESALLEAARKLSKHSDISDGLIGEPEIWGIQLFDANQVVLRLVQKCKPSTLDSASRQLRTDVRDALVAGKFELANNDAKIFVNLASK